MRIERYEAEPSQADGFRAYRGQDWDFFWLGTLFLPGERMGEPSILALEGRIQKEGFLAAIVDLKGVFCCLARDRQAGELHIFNDHAGLRRLYRTTRQVSPSFLELVRDAPHERGDLDLEALIEFMELGACYYQRSLLTGIRYFARDEIVTFRRGVEGYTVSHKRHTDLREPTRYGRFAYFESLAKALEAEHVHVDLTGGVDSRYTAVMLRHFGLKFTVGLASRQDHLDAIVSQRVATALGLEHIRYDYRYDNFETELRNTFEITDGLGDCGALVRPMAYCRELQNRGTTVNFLSIGETYKDWIWYQDFPMYGVRKVNFNRLFRYRIASTRMRSSLWNQSIQARTQAWANNYVKRLEAFRFETNTQSYDAFIALGKGTAAYSVTATARSQFVPTILPYIDIDIVREAIVMNPWRRVFDQVYRADMTRVNPVAARIQTGDGLTISSAGVDKTMDAFRLLRFYGKRLVKVAGRKLYGKSFFQPTADQQGHAEDLKASPLCADGIRRLQQLGVLASEVGPAEIGGRAGRMIGLGLLLDTLESTGTLRLTT